MSERQSESSAGNDATRATPENHRPWGHYDVLTSTPDHQVKTITVAPGQRLSLQMHDRRSEHWVIVRGEAIATLDGRDVLLGVGDHIFIGVGSAHRMANPGPEPLVFIEVQIGDYFGEDDIVRIEDDFGRVSS
ncbi:MAG: phosphomannose isomerase type II C-terminal cupin domain [Proteobacteria bacterium]|nr:phosphomannose isomerase type II C-terminal cupin domain [Pseudomonadota bacterium]